MMQLCMSIFRLRYSGWGDKEHLSWEEKEAYISSVMDRLGVKGKDRLTADMIEDKPILRFLSKLRLNSLW